MLKITNRSTGNKRIRLTALDSAMSNIDDGVGAIAKDGKDVLICLSPTVEERPSDINDEMYFTTLAGSVDYIGTQGDQILLSDGTILDVTVTDDTFTFNVPAGKHKVKFVESIDRSNFVSIGGEALVEINNFPTLSSVNAFSTYLCTNLVKVPTVLPNNITSLDVMFHGATSFNQDISMWDVSNVNSMNGMFYNASAFNQPLNNWDVSKVTNMNGMFWGTKTFDQDISSWGVSNVNDMDYMFDNASSFNQDLSQWCVSNITSLPFHFDQGATSWTSPRPVWGTCPAEVVIDDALFTKATFVKTDDSGRMWIYAEYLPENINGKLHIDWGDGTKEVYDPKDFVVDDYEVYVEHTYDINDEYVVKVYSTAKVNNLQIGEITKVSDWGLPFSERLTLQSANLVEVPTTLHPAMIDLSSLFREATAFNQDISMWDTSNVINMSHMFYGAGSFNQPIGSWNVSKVMDMTRMFFNAYEFNQDLSRWCVSLINSLPAGFSSKSSLSGVNTPVWGTCPLKPEVDEIPSNEMHFTTLAGSIEYVGTQGDQMLLSDGTTVDVASTDEMFSFNVPAGKHLVKLVESVDRSNYVSIGGEALVELHNFPTLSVVNVMDFCPNSGSPNLVKVPNVLPSNITSLAYMFSDAIAFNQPLNSWNVSNVTNMNTMFYGATAFDQPLNSWNVSNVTNMSYMFENASAFNQDLSQWCVSNITEHPSSFDLRATNWSLPRPVWGTCPRGENIV